MIEAGYYNFEGNLLIYEGGDSVYDVDSATYYPVEILFASEYVGPIEDYQIIEGGSVNV